MTMNSDRRGKRRLLGRSSRSAARTDLTEWQERRLRLMAGIQVSLLGLLAVAFVTVVVEDYAAHRSRGTYLALILGATIPLIAALALNRAGRFTSSALVTVATAVAAPWSTVLLDPAVLAGDSMPLAYVIVSVTLAAMLLGTRMTIAVAGVQWLALLLLAVLGPETPFNWVSLLTFIFFMSVICVLGNIVIQRDLRQIHRQARSLASSEAELREQSIRDPLTDLFNRRYMQEALALEIERSRRSGGATSLMIVDVDHFKHLNDSFGHAAGDGVLRQLASLLSAHTRASDVVCRYGGDEFVVILPETTARVALVRAQRLAREIRETLVVGGEGQNALTVSVGLATFPKHGSSAIDLLEAADVGLYRAKADGRDCAREGEAVIQRFPMTA